MGFYVEPTHYRLKFEDPKYAELEINVESIDIGMLTELMSLASFGDIVNMKSITTVTGAMNKMFEAFADKLISWNLEDKYKNPIPANLDGVRKQEPNFIMMVIMNWMGALGSVDSFLPKDLSSGETSLMESLKMEIS
jgi:hypothetical protein